MSREDDDARPEGPTSASASAAATAAQREAASFVGALSSSPRLPEGGGLHRLLVESVRDYAIFALDAAGHVVSWNEGAARIKGYAEHEILGRHFSTFYPPEDIAAGKPAWELEVASDVGRLEDEGWRLRKDGSRFWANVVITALRNDAGALVGFAKVTRDLTERRESDLRAIADARRLAAAEGANRAKEEFLASLSHELRTPLNAIGGYLELLVMGLAGEITERQRDYLARIQGSQRHLLGIIDDLLNYSQMASSPVRYELVSSSADEMVAHVLSLVQILAEAKGLRLERQGCAPTLLVHADRKRTEQILLNLLSNAVKFTPSGGRITAGCEERGDRVQFSVRDTGIGIPSEQQEAIFEPFVQLGRQFSSTHEGTGLGLAISRDLARGMGGELTVESQVDFGSTFTLSLPKG